jgi:SAM-dependent methyltransferase
MAYTDYTFRDKNPIKRWLQARRLLTALNICRDELPSMQRVCDFGAGNGELCKHISACAPSAQLICYEPTPSLLEEAKVNLGQLTQLEFCSDIHTVPSNSLDAIFCLEVFEHLPSEETLQSLCIMQQLLKPNGLLVIGVPVEIGIPALYKGIFRMFRRYGEFDANLKNVWCSFLGKPPLQRPAAEIAPGFRFHFHHIGFDFRDFKVTLAKYFPIQSIAASPSALFGPSLMPEVYFVARKKPL